MGRGTCKWQKRGEIGSSALPSVARRGRVSGGAPRVEMWCALTSAVSSATECDRVQILRLAPPTLLAPRIWHCFRRTAGYGQPGLAGSECGSGPTAAGCSTRVPGCCGLGGGSLTCWSAALRASPAAAAVPASAAEKQPSCGGAERAMGAGCRLRVLGAVAGAEEPCTMARACPGPVVASTQRGGAEPADVGAERRRESLNMEVF